MGTARSGNQRRLLGLIERPRGDASTHGRTETEKTARVVTLTLVPSRGHTLPSHIEEALRVIKTKLARRPPPAVVATLSSRLEYREFSVRDKDALVAAPEHRLGRHIGDVLPVDMTEGILRTIYDAKRTAAPTVYRYTSRTGETYRGLITVVHRERIELVSRLAMLLAVGTLAW